MLPLISFRRRVLVTLVTVLSLFVPRMAFGQFSGAGAGTANDPYLIFNPAQLNQVRNYVNNPDVYFSLGADIDLSSWISTNQPAQGWLPIGTSSTPFKGKFLGNKHAIKGLKITRDTNHVGLFGYLDGAQITDLTLEGEVQGGSYVGLLAGYATAGSLRNINVKAIVAGSANVGGLAGYYNGTISNCHATSEITAWQNVGGLIGCLSRSNINNCSTNANLSIKGLGEAGGVIGYAEYEDIESKNQYTPSYTFENLSAEIAISGESGITSNIGGIIGKVHGETNYDYSGNYSKLLFSKLKASIHIVNTCSNTGGLIGLIDRKTNYAHPTTFAIEKSYSIGDIVASNASCVGGIIGDCVGTTIQDSYFTGSITGSTNVGGISGKSGSIYRCYTNANISGSELVGGISGLNSETIKTSFSLCPNISASQKDVGRIFGNGAPTCGEIGTPETNYSLVTSKVSVNGKEVPYTPCDKSGDVSSMETMKMRATYQGLGWDFGNEWTLLETECLPYKQTQTAPPMVLSVPTSGSFMISGKSLNNGTVFVQYDGQVYNTEAVNNTWTVRTDPLKAGENITVWAKEADKFRSYNMNYTVAYPGSGTEEDPYLIYTVSDLANLNGAGWYKLMNDLDLSGVDWQPVGRTAAVMTVFDGDNHTIKGLTVNQGSTNYCGLFSAISGATIKNITISGASVTGGDGCGIIAGALTDCTIDNVQVLNSSVKGGADCGSICGSSNGTVFTNVTAIGSSVKGTGKTGGICGYAQNQSSFTLVGFNGTVNGGTHIGGIVGYNVGCNITRSCSEGTVSSTSDASIGGGIVGYNTGSIADCFSTAEVTSVGYTGGIVGLNFADITRCYASGNLNSGTLAAGITAYNDGSKSSLTACAVATEKINITSQTGNGMRVIGGIRNGASLPETASNKAFSGMIVSVNGVPQEIYDDPMNGTGTSGDALRTQSTYTEMGWKFPSVWTINGSAMPQLAGMSATGTVRNDNYIYAEAIKTSSGEVVDLSIMLKNRDVANGFQFDMTLPDGMTIDEVYDEFYEENILSIEKGARLTAQQILANKAQPTGAMRILCYSSGNAAIPGDDGEVIRVKIKLAESVVNGNYNIRFNNIFLSNNGTSITLSNVSVPVKVINDKLNAEPVEIMKGKSGNIAVTMDNKSEITGLQFDVFLPEGITFDTKDGEPVITVGSRGQDAHILQTKLLDNGATRVVVYAGNAYALFSGNEGDVVNMSVNVPESIETGTYNVVFKNIFLANKELKSVECSDFTSPIVVTRVRRKGDVNVDATINVADISCAQLFQFGKENNDWDKWSADINDDEKITVSDVKEVSYLVLDEVYAPSRNKTVHRSNNSTEPTYSEDIHLYFEPICINPGETKELTLYLLNPTMKVSATTFYVRLPQGFSFETNGMSDLIDEPLLWYQENPARVRDFSFVGVYDEEKGAYGMSHVNINRRYYAKSSGPIITFRLKVDENVKPGVYKATREDLEFLDEVDNYYCGPDEAFSIVVGDISTQQHVELYGRFNEDVTTSLKNTFASSDKLLSLDLTGVEDTPEGTSFTSANPNTVVFTNQGQTLSAAPNTVVDGKCTRLELVDGHSFGVTREFMADEAVYTRQMAAGELSSIILPFANEAEAGVEFGIESNINSGTLEVSYEPTVHNANEPCLIYAVDGGIKTLSANNVTIAPLAVADNTSRMFGNYVHGTSEEPVYEVNNGNLALTSTLAPFRAYFSQDSISDITVGIKDVFEDLDENAEIYNLMGIRIKVDIHHLAPGIYIVNGRKVYVK